MNDGTSIPDRRNPLTPALMDTIRLVRRLRDELHASAEALHAALDVIADRDARCDRLEDSNRHLRAQLRAAATGRTIAAERQQLEAEASGEYDEQEPAEVRAA